jgi:NitT/TauT family transport system permease protein
MLATESMVAAPAGAIEPTSEPSRPYRDYLRSVRLRRRLVLGSQIALLALFFAAWEVAPRAHWVNPMLTSYPSAIGPTFVNLIGSAGNEGNILDHTWLTFLRSVVGFTAAMILGVGFAVILWLSSFLQRVVDPFLVVANALPKIALVPIFYIWLGATTSIYGMAVAISIFITIIMIYNGFREIDPNKIKLVRTFGASRWQTMRMVILPGSVPTMIAALKINVGLALVGVIVGEFQSAKAGLGFLIIYGSQIYQMNMVMTAIVILAVISTLMYVAIAVFEGRVLKARR